MKSSYNQTTPKIVGGAVIGFIALAALYFFIYAPIATKNSTNSQTTESNQTGTNSIAQEQQTNTTPQSVASNQTSTTSAYKTGTYTASVNYVVPKSNNNLTVQMTLDNGKVTSVKTTHDYTDRESDLYIANFDSLIEEQVTGKSISDLSIGRLGGASLTSNAFDDAIATIKNEAKS